MNQNNRILIVDALRGFALFLIILIHYVEHFELFKLPEVNFLFSAETDAKVAGLIVLLVSGKAYSVFALLFGFSFFIQLDRKAQKGIDFRATFLWRLIILMIMGFVHSLIYRGDILHVYAILGIPLILMYKINTKALVVLSILLVLQIPFIYQFILSFVKPDYEYVQRIPTYWGEGAVAYSTGSFWDVVNHNLWKGRVSVWAWTVYNGRYLQLFALYIIGLVLGKEKIFENIRLYKKSVWKVLIISVVGFVIFKIVQNSLMKAEFSGIQKQFLNTILNSYTNLAVTTFLICGIILLYLRFEKAYVFKLFSSYGKMSLSNYVFQAVSGVLLFYGFSLALYKYLGTTWSVIMGILFFYLQAIISNWWNKKFYYGPLEWIWRAFTFWDFKLKFVRKPE